ncbi:MAG: GDP-mannose dehydrogenase [Alphaproteobacteria bacterium]|nr:GDP-mannose dehydrogenase [Alphaproteobacteria bacterium]
MTVTVGYAGLTHLGLVSSVGAAVRGHEVVAFDADGELVARLAGGVPSVSEPRLPEAMAESGERLKFTADPAALAGCDLVYVAPDVPTDDAGRSDTGPVEDMLSTVFSACGDDALVIVLSQVSPGFTRQHAGPHPNLYYQVETLIFGRALERTTEPERYIVGCADPSRPLPGKMAEFLESFGCPILPMRYESAELAKIAINCMLVSSVSAANTLAEVCEAIGADWSEIIPALQLDRRIGPYAYLKPGLGISGGNLERDLATVRNLAAAHTTDAGVVAAWQDNSCRRKAWAGDVLERELGDRLSGARVAVLGLAYKENTHSVKNSPALVLAERLIAAGARVLAFDPVVTGPLDMDIDIVSSADAAVEQADAVAIMTPWPEFAQIVAADLATHMNGRLIVDPYGMIVAAEALTAGLTHFRLGVQPSRSGVT